MKRLVFILFVFINFIGYSQIIIDKTDMPVPGKYYTLSNAVSINGNDFTLTGANYSWDFSTLKPLSQTQDTFLNISSVPLTYTLFFNSFLYPKTKSTVVEPQNNLAIDTLIGLSDVYNFFNLSDTAYKQTGYGGTLSGIQIPFTYDNLDRIYKLPMLFGNKDSCTSSFAKSIPGIGYLSQIKHRKNTIDGWGTLKTPYGTFQTLRVKTEIAQKDSIEIDTLGISLPAINSSYTEYEWLAKGFADPLLSITQEGLITTVTYIDSLRKSFSINEYANNSSLKVYPNPATNNLNVSYKLLNASKVEIILTDILGNEINEIRCANQTPGLYNFNIPIEHNKIHTGIYLLNIKTDDFKVVKKVIIY